MSKLLISSRTTARITADAEHEALGSFGKKSEKKNTLHKNNVQSYVAYWTNRNVVTFPFCLVYRKDCFCLIGGKATANTG